MNQPLIIVSDWKPRQSGTLVGFFTAHLPSGFTLRELMLHERDGKWWISFPSKPMLTPDGTALRDERGKVRYGPPLIEFASRQDRDRFTEQVLAALRQAQPQLFAAERAGMNPPAAIRQAAALTKETTARIFRFPKLNERFTIYLDADGSPVQRPLREMTAGEVVAAWEWSMGEVTRFEREKREALQALAAGLQALTARLEKEGRIFDSADFAQLMRETMGAVRWDAAGAAMDRHTQLLLTLHGAMPQWLPHRMGLREALGRYWTRGRAAGALS